MKHLLGFFKAACSIGAAVVIGFTIGRISTGGDNIILFVLASLFALAAACLSFAAGALLDRVEALESAVGMNVDRGWGEGSGEKKECPVCHSLIDSDLETCPYCENRAFDDAYFHTASKPAVFDTENDAYRGTDFSGEEVVSANSDSFGSFDNFDNFDSLDNFDKSGKSGKSGKADSSDKADDSENFDSFNSFNKSDKSGKEE